MSTPSKRTLREFIGFRLSATLSRRFRRAVKAARSTSKSEFARSVIVAHLDAHHPEQAAAAVPQPEGVAS